MTNRCIGLLLLFVLFTDNAFADYLICPDGRQIETELKGSRELRKATEGLKIEKRQTRFEDLPGWSDRSDPDSLSQAMRNNCNSKRLPAGWPLVCDALAKSSPANIHALIESHFTPYQVLVEGSDKGKYTSYYAPYINVSRNKDEHYRYPIYRSSGAARKLSRSELDAGVLPDQEALFWSDSYMDTFFLGVQGSGVGKLPDGRKVSILYDSKNTHNYVSIGKTLIKCGEVPAEIMSMPAIKDWVAGATPTQVSRLVNNNQSYVFFREQAHNGNMPFGALGVRLTAMRSLAVDKRYVPLGTLTYVSVPHPLGEARIQRAFLAQDIGGAISGGIRADIFAGEGDTAEKFAGNMAHNGQFWLFEARVPTSE